MLSRFKLVCPKMFWLKRFAKGCLMGRMAQLRHAFCRTCSGAEGYSAFPCLSPCLVLGFFLYALRLALYVFY